MDNPEYIFQLLETFSKLRRKDIIPQDLEEYITYVARTGDPVFQWSLVKVLLKEKLVSVLNDFHKDSPSLDIPECANVEPFRYDVMKVELLSKLDSFSSAPFTVQRICELLSAPRKEYKRIDKYMRAVEKNVLVVSTRDSMIKRSLEAENLNESVINGVESDKDDGNVDILHDDKNLNSDEKMIVTEDEGEVFTIDSRFEEWNEDNDEQEILDPSIPEADLTFDKIESKETSEEGPYSLMQFGSLHEGNIKLDIQLHSTSESNRKKLATSDNLQKTDHFLLSERLTSKVTERAENAYHKILETFQLSGKACEEAVHVGHEMTTSEIEQILSEDLSPTYSPIGELENENDDFETECNSPLHVVNDPGLEINDLQTGEKDTSYQEIIVLPELCVEGGKTSEIIDERSNANTNLFKNIIEVSQDKVSEKEAENLNGIHIEEMMEEIVEANEEINAEDCENKKLEMEEVGESGKTLAKSMVEKEPHDENTEEQKFEDHVEQYDKSETNLNPFKDMLKISEEKEIDTETDVTEIEVTNQEIFTYHEDQITAVIESYPKTVNDEVKEQDNLLGTNESVSKDVNNLLLEENREIKENEITVDSETIIDEFKDEKIKEDESTITKTVESTEMKKLEESGGCTETSTNIE